MGRTDPGGVFRVALEPGDYVVTAEAGLSCEPVPVRVEAGRYTHLVLTCDTGIR